MLKDNGSVLPLFFLLILLKIFYQNFRGNVLGEGKGRSRSTSYHCLAASQAMKAMKASARRVLQVSLHLKT